MQPAVPSRSRSAVYGSQSCAVRIRRFWPCCCRRARSSAAFFLLPLARLFLVGGSGPDGFATYATIITDKNHFASLLATLALAAATTVVTLIVSGLAGVFLQRNKFPGNAALVAMLTLPLAFPGVVIGFMVIMLAGRQGLIGDITQALTGEKVVFAYSMAGLFMGYVYFSIPRDDPDGDGHRREARSPAGGSRPLARRLALAASSATSSFRA